MCLTFIFFHFLAWPTFSIVQKAQQQHCAKNTNNLLLLLSLDFSGLGIIFSCDCYLEAEDYDEKASKVRGVSWNSLGISIAPWWQSLGIEGNGMLFQSSDNAYIIDWALLSVGEENRA